MNKDRLAGDMPAVSLRAASHGATAKLVASQVQSGSRSRWNGTVSAEEPIVALSFLRHRDRVYWARSPKVEAAELPLCLLLTTEHQGSMSCFYVTWSIGQGGQCQLRLDGDAPSDLRGSVDRDIVLGEPFRFIDVGPDVSLFGLILPRAQVKGRRKRLWGLRDEYLSGLSVAWCEIMAHGRTGVSTSDILHGA
jgi:hypothetical protein